MKHMKRHTIPTMRFGGFTLVEVLVSTSIFLLATTAILAALLFFLRAERSYSMTAAFSSNVRLAHERMMQELRNAEMNSADPVPTATSLTVRSYDLAGNQWKISFYADTTSSGTRLVQSAVPVGGGTARVSEVYSGLNGFKFTYFDRSGSNPTNSPVAATDVKAVQLEITPKLRSQLIWGKDSDTIRDADPAKLVFNLIHLRNAS